MSKVCTIPDSDRDAVRSWNKPTVSNITSAMKRNSAYEFSLPFLTEPVPSKGGTLGFLVSQLLWMVRPGKVGVQRIVNGYIFSRLSLARDQLL